MKTRLLILFMLMSVAVQAQNVNVFKRGNAPLDSTEKKVKFLINLDARNSYVLGNKVKFGGLRLGVEINHRHRVGMGFYGLRDPVFLDATAVLVPERDSIASFIDTVDVRFDFGYFALFYDRVLFKNKRWEASLPFQLGFGTIRGSYKDRLNRDWLPIEAPVSLLEMGAFGQYNLLPWLGLGVGAGYRWMMVSDREVQKAFNAPVYSFKVKIMLGELYRTVFKKDKKETTDE